MQRRSIQDVALAPAVELLWDMEILSTLASSILVASEALCATQSTLFKPQICRHQPTRLPFRNAHDSKDNQFPQVERIEP